MMEILFMTNLLRNYILVKDLLKNKQEIKK